jgi:hypothetical protein
VGNAYQWSPHSEFSYPRPNVLVFLAPTMPGLYILSENPKLFFIRHERPLMPRIHGLPRAAGSVSRLFHKPAATDIN